MRAISLVLGLMLATAADAQTNFSYTGSVQTYTVPVGVTSVRIVAAGAQGGSVTVSCAASGGLGARMEGDFTVTPGEVLSVLVGQQGLTNGSDAGGGGGSFVVRTGNVPLLVAGGGGGATNNIGQCGANRNGIDASVTTSGTASGNGVVAGGANGNGGGASTGSGGGGGGFITDGVAGIGVSGNNGKSYLNGGAGGNGNNNDFGGFGGGGAGWFTGGNGGGGGGYSGGGTSGSQPYTGGGGGGSYNAGTNQLNLAGSQSGNGSVTITAVAPPDADLAVSVTSGSSTVHVGQSAQFGIGVSNDGPEASGAISLLLTLDAEIAGASATSPNGWTCDAAVVGVGETTITCDAADMAANTSAMFSVSVPTSNALGGTTISLQAVVDAAATDPTPANDFDSASVSVVSSANLRLSISGPTIPVRSGTSVPVSIRLDNYGSDAAAYPVVMLNSSSSQGSLTAAPPAGWNCGSYLPTAVSGQAKQAPVPAPGLSVICEYDGFLPRGSSVLRFNVTAPANPPGGFITLNGNVMSATSDPVPDNNSSSFKLYVKPTATIGPVSVPNH